MLTADGVWGGYTKENVVQDVSLAVKPGEFVGVIGPNGCGKSTLLKLLTRVLPLRKGTVTFEGKDMSLMKRGDFSRKAAFVPQDTFIHFPFTVQEIVMMGRIPHLNRLQFETAKDRALAHEALLLTETASLREKEIDKLSAGERQRVIIAKALAQEPALLFLDEPTSHLDIGHQIKILDLLRKLNHDRKLAVVIVLHDLNLAGEYCDRLLLMDAGRVFKEGRPEEVLTYAHIEAVYKTVVVVKSNPFSSKPYVILAPGRSL